MLYDPNAKAYDQPTLHFTGDDGRTHFVTLQGKMLIWKVSTKPTILPPTEKRGKVMGFSDESRWRMLKLIASVDWTETVQCLFVTLTFPDQFDRLNRKALTQARSVFWRGIEKHLGRKVACIWRLEWQQRKSGSRQGQFMPHYHLLTFREKYIPMDAVNTLWKKAIAHEGYVRTEVKRCANSDQAASYVAKYQAKVFDSSLVNTAYLNIPGGRQWGILRKELIPFCEECYFHLRPSSALDHIRSMAAAVVKDCNLTGSESFTVLGKHAEVLRKIFLDLLVEMGGR